MTLGRLIEILESLPQDHPVCVRLGDGHSDRGFYEDLAFEPVIEHSTVGVMLADAQAQLGKTHTGYKGGEYVMGEYSDVKVGRWSQCGEDLSCAWLALATGHDMAQAMAWQAGAA